MMPDPVSCCCWPLTLMLTTEGKTALATAAAVPDFAPGADTGLPWAPRLTAAAVPEPSSEPTNVAPIATPPAPPTSAPAATRAARRSPRRCDARGGPPAGPAAYSGCGAVSPQPPVDTCSAGEGELHQGAGGSSGSKSYGFTACLLRMVSPYPIRLGATSEENVKTLRAQSTDAAESLGSRS